MKLLDKLREKANATLADYFVEQEVQERTRKAYDKGKKDAFEHALNVVQKEFDYLNEWEYGQQFPEDLQGMSRCLETLKKLNKE